MHLPVEPRLPAPGSAARGGRCSRSRPGPGVPRRLPDEEPTTPFVGMILLLYSVGRYADGKAAPRGGPGDPRGELVLLAAWRSGFDGFERRSLAHLPVRPAGAGRARAAQPGRSSRRSCASRPQVESDARERPAAVEEERARIAERAAGARRERRQRDGRQAEAVPRASTRATRRAPARRSLRSRRPAGRRSARCAGCSACCAARTTALGSRRSRAWRASRRWWSEPRARPRRESRGRGGRRELPPGIDLAAYRVLEDALEAAAAARERPTCSCATRTASCSCR